MTEEWLVYQALKFEHPTIVAAIDEIEEHAEGAYPYVFRATLPIENLDENGFPDLTELDQLSEAEDQAAEAWEEAGILYAGRMTGNGERSFIVYMKSEDQRNELERSFSQWFSGYIVTIEQLTEEEPWDVYYEMLMPDPFEAQMMANEGLLEQLEENGDPGEVARRIDHWAYFESVEDAKAFIVTAEKMNLQLEELDTQADEDGHYKVHLYHEGIPVDIHETTLDLTDAAFEHNGMYDGWETEVVKQKKKFMDFFRRN